MKRFRLNVELTKEQRDFMDTLNWGYGKVIISCVLNLIIDLINRHGSKGLAAILAGTIHLDIDKENANE